MPIWVDGENVFFVCSEGWTQYPWLGGQSCAWSFYAESLDWAISLPV